MALSSIYTNCPINSNQVRIIEPVNGQEEPLSYKFHIHTLEKCPPYTAISYAWGDPKSETCPVRIDGRPIYIRQNLWHFLDQVRLNYKIGFLWIDAICIDQNNPVEKSEQVLKMGHIYSRATEVYAWLGEADCETNRVFDVLHEFRDRKREAGFPIHYDAAEQLSYHRQLFRDIYEDKVGALPQKSKLDDDMLHEEFNWLRPLYVRPYWSRVWIVQELVLAKVVVVCCGDKYIDFDDIYGLSLDWGSFEQGFDTGTYQMLKPHSRGWNTIQAIRGHRRRREVGWEIGGEVSCLMNFEMSERGDVAIFDEVIGIYAQHHECSCPKDKVYGFRELVPQWRENLVVDYARSDLEVFLDVTKLDLFEPKKHGGWRVAFCLWLAMGLGDFEKFKDSLRQSYPEISIVEMSYSFEIKTPKVPRHLRNKLGGYLESIDRVP